MDDALKTAILKNKPLAAELKHVLDDLIPQLVRYNSVMFTGATDDIINQELNAGIIVTKDLYALSEALNAAAVEQPKPKASRKKKSEAPAETDPQDVPPSDPTDITPQPIPELPEHAASTVGEPNDSDKTS